MIPGPALEPEKGRRRAGGNKMDGECQEGLLDGRRGVAMVTGEGRDQI